MDYETYRRSVLLRIKCTLYPANTESIIVDCYKRNRAAAVAAAKIQSLQEKLYGV